MLENAGRYDKFNSIYLKKTIADYKTAVDELNNLIKRERISMERKKRDIDKTKIEKLIGKVKYLTQTNDAEEIYPKPVEFSSVIESLGNKKSEKINVMTFPHIVKEIAVKPDSLFLGKIKQRIVSNNNKYDNPFDRCLSIIDLFEINPILTHNDRAYISRLAKVYTGLYKNLNEETITGIEKLRKLKTISNIIQTFEDYMKLPSYISDLAVS